MEHRFKTFLKNKQNYDISVIPQYDENQTYTEEEIEQNVYILLFHLQTHKCMKINRWTYSSHKHKLYYSQTWKQINVSHVLSLPYQNIVSMFSTSGCKTVRTLQSRILKFYNVYMDNGTTFGGYKFNCKRDKDYDTLEKEIIQEPIELSSKQMIAAISAISVVPIAVTPSNIIASMPPCYDQGALGSCTANAGAGMYYYKELSYPSSSTTYFQPSRLYIYYYSRKYEGLDTTKDTGIYRISSVLSAMKLNGVCPEDDKYGSSVQWIYDITKFSTVPPASCATFGTINKLVGYSAVTQTLSQLKSCLLTNNPFIFGMIVYNTFFNVTSSLPIVPIPIAKKDYIVGGHCMMCVGYNDKIAYTNNKKKEYGCFIVRNSWGTSWGVNGYCYIPYALMINRSYIFDIYKINGVAKPTAVVV